MASAHFTRTPEREIKAKDKELKKVGDCTQDTFIFRNSFNSLKSLKRVGHSTYFYCINEAQRAGKKPRPLLL